MRYSKIFSTIQTLEKNEWRSLHLFVQSPFFNHRKDVVDLTAYLAKHAHLPDTDKAHLKESAWKTLFPGTDYDDKTMRYLMSQLLGLVEQFFAHVEMQADKTAHTLFTFNALRKRGLEKAAETMLQSAEQEAPTDPLQLRSIRQHRRQLLAQQNRHTEVPMPDMLEQHTLESVIETLHEGCTYLDYRAFLPIDQGFPLLYCILDFCEKNALHEKYPSVAMQYHAFRMLEKMSEHSGEAHYFELKKLLGESLLPTQKTIATWLHAINFAIRRQNQGNRAFAQEAFDLYKTGLERGVLLENGRISKKTYSNTLVLSLLAGEWEWAELFLKEYRQYLPEKERDNTYRHNLATYYFKKKKYNLVLETLQGVNFTDLLHNLDDRRLLLCSYYELGEFAALESLLDSFAIWLRRAKNLGYHRELYGNLVKFTRRLIDVKNQRSGAKERLRKDIISTQTVAAKEWLLEKLLPTPSPPPHPS